MAPTSTIPWMELAADISGVCKVAGTLLMTSKPTQRLRTKMMKSVRSKGSSGSLGRVAVLGRVAGFGGRGWCGLGRRGLGQGRVNDRAIADDDDARYQLV